MKKTFFLALFSLFSFCVFSQTKNVNIDNLWFTLSYRNLPSKPLNPLAFSYGVQINLPKNLESMVDLDGLYNKFIIEGQHYTENPTDKDVVVVINMSNVDILSSDIKEYVSENKDKEGNVTRTYSYKVIVSYSFSADAYINQGNDKLGSYLLFSSYKPMIFETDFYRSSRDASEYWKNNRENLKERFARDLSNEAIKMTSQRASTEYGFPSAKKSELIKTINEKKHDENLAFRAASDKLKGLLESMTPDTSISEEDVADIITYFKGIPEKYTDLKLKADIRLRYAAYYNLAKIYYYLDQPEKVKPYADLIFENGHDKGDCKKLDEAANKLIERFNSSPIRSRHFNPDIFIKE